jgi:transcription-repair coupling factor (superfamily II helicase)
MRWRCRGLPVPDDCWRWSRPARWRRSAWPRRSPGSQAGLALHLLPDWETLPYDSFSPHQDLISERLATLHAVIAQRMRRADRAAATALTRMAPPAFLAGHTFFLKKGERSSSTSLRAQLTLAGYQHVTQVVAPANTACAAGWSTCFRWARQLPYRIELFDDEIETIRTFDVDSSARCTPVPEIRLLPAREFPPAMPAARCSAALPRSLRGRRFAHRTVQGCLQRHPAGRHRVLPAAVLRETGTLFDYLPQDATLLAMHGDVRRRFAEFWQRHARRHKMLGGDRSRPVLPPGDLFLPTRNSSPPAKPAAQPAPRPWRRHEGAGAVTLPPLAVDRKAADPLAALRGFLGRFDGRVLLLAESPGRRQTHRRLPGRIRHAPAGLRRLRKLPRRRMNASCSASARCPAAWCWTRSPSSPRTSSTPPPPAPGARRTDARRANLEGWLRDLSELQDRRPGGA